MLITDTRADNDQLNFEKSCPPPKQWEGVKFQNTAQAGRRFI